MIPTNDSNQDSGQIHLLDFWRVIRVRLPLVILTFLLVVITTGVVTYFLPRQYMSTAVIEVQQNDVNLEIFGNSATGNRWDPRFATQQFQIIQRKEVLDPVIERLGLNTKWREEYDLRTKDQIYEKLRRMLDVREIRNTDLIQISVFSTDPNEAATLANAITEEYQRRRTAEQQNWAYKSLATLEDEVNKQRKRVEELRAEAAKIRIESGIIDLNPETVEDPGTAQDRVLMSVEEQVSTERLRVSALQAKYDLISQMTDDQILRSTRELQIEDPTILQFLPVYQEGKAQIAHYLSSGLGENHPTVQALQARIQVIEEQLKDQVTALRKTLSSNLEIARRSLENLEAQLERSRNEQQQIRTNAAAYAEAKNNYIQAKKILEAAELRFSAEMMQRTMPRNPAIIWERAEPAEFPARPRVLLNMILGVLVGVIFSVGLAFLIEYMDTSVKTMEDVERYLAVPVLAVVPKGVGFLPSQATDHRDAEAYRILRTNVEFKRKTPEANTITMVSGGAGEGKSTTLANLAYTFAMGGYRTLIIDADLRRPSQHRLFGFKNDYGLTNYLTSESTNLEELIRKTSVENLFVMTSGKLPIDAVGILNSQRLIDLIGTVKRQYDMVFFDAPPILGVSDASVLVSALDLTIIVVQHRRFPRAMLQRVKNAVLQVGGNILGVVLNNVDVRHDQYYEYYTSYYTYYSTERSQNIVGESMSQKAAASAGEKTKDQNSSSSGEY